MKYYTITGDKPEYIEGKNCVWCEQDLFYIASDLELGDPYKPATLPVEAQESINKALREAKDAKIVELNAECDKRLTRFKSSALGEEYTYDLSPEDQINYMGLAMAGVDAFMRCYKTDTEGNIVGIKDNLPHTAEQIKQAYADGSNHKMTQIAKCGQLKLAVEEADSIDLVNQIVWRD